MHRRPAFRLRNRRAASPIIATILLVAITVTLVAVLVAFLRPPPLGKPSALYYTVQGGLTEPAWGDGSDCSNVNGAQQCLSLPAFELILTMQAPSGMPLSFLTLYFFCNSTVYLKASLAAMEWVPGTSATPGGNAPQLGHCGSYVPPAAAFNRLAFFQQLNPGSTNLIDGDVLVVYAHTFTSFKDDDFHGAPPWCYTVANACLIELVYTGQPSTTVIQVPLFGIST